MADNTIFSEVSITVMDRAENRPLYFSGSAAECPPVPHVGDRIEMGHFNGIVEKVTHVHREYATGMRLQIIVQISPLSVGESKYSDKWNV